MGDLFVEKLLQAGGGKKHSVKKRGQFLILMEIEVYGLLDYEADAVDPMENVA